MGQRHVVRFAVEHVRVVAGDVELAGVGRVLVEEPGAVVNAHREVRRNLVAGEFLEVDVVERCTHADFAVQLVKHAQVESRRNGTEVKDVVGRVVVTVLEGVLQGVVVDDVHGNHVHLLTLGNLAAHAHGEPVVDAVGETALHNAIHVERIDGHVGEDEAAVQVRGNASVNPDGRADAVERKFRIHLDSHVQTLVVVGVEHVGQFGVCRERVHEDGRSVEPEYLRRIGSSFVKSLQVLHVVVGGEVRFERPGAAQV